MNIIKLLRNYLLLLKSDLFDSKYYLKENPDVAKAKANPILHYLKFGWKEGRNPSPLFNTNNYLSFRPDIIEADICPLVHYELFGKKELLSFCFDKIKYLENKISDLDTKYGRKTADLDTKFNKKTTDLDIKFNKKTIDLDTKFNKKTIDLDTKFEKKTTDLDTKFNKKTTDLDTKFNKKTIDLDTKFEKKTTDLDTKFNKKTIDLDTKFNKKTTDLDTKFNKKTIDLDTKFNKKTTDLNKFKNDILYLYNRGINKEKVSCKIEKYLEFNELGITNEKREPELIVSLTSYPDRMYDIYYCIYSLLTQTLKPNKIILWLGEEQFPNKEKDLPKNLLKFTKYGLTIKYTKDIKSYKKLIPSLKEYPNSIIITADDDIFYPQNWLEKLYNCWKNNKDCVVCHRAHRVGIENEKLIPYNKWEHNIIADKSSFYNFCTTGGGVLYHPNSFYKDIFNEKIFKELTPNADDIWFWAMVVLNDTKIKIVDEPLDNLIYVNPERQKGFNDDDTLYFSNVYENKNDIQLEKVINYYPQIMEKLLNEQ